MAKRDSYLVKQVKKLERIADKANSKLSEYYFYSSPEGRAAEAVDHIHEVVHEALIKFDEDKKKEKEVAELEKIRERMAKKNVARPEPLPPDRAFQGLDARITNNKNKSAWERRRNKLKLYWSQPKGTRYFRVGVKGQLNIFQRIYYLVIDLWRGNA